MLGTFEKIETSSESSDETEESSEEENDFTRQTHFMNNTSLTEYEKN